MFNAFATTSAVPLRHVVGIGPVTARDAASRRGVVRRGPSTAERGQRGWGAARPRSRRGDRGIGDLLLVLLSGGGSALMALPAEDLTLAEKQQTARILMEQGADIYELNTVRKHLSAIKGGQLAAVCHRVGPDAGDF